MATSAIAERALFRALTKAVANEIRLAAAAGPFAQLLTRADANHALICARRDAAAAAARKPWTQLGVELGGLIHDQVKAHPTLTLQAIFNTPAVQVAVHHGVRAAQEASKAAILEGWQIGVAAGLADGQAQLGILGAPLGDPHPPPQTKYVTALLSDVDRNARRVQARLMVGANTKAGLGGIKLTVVSDTVALAGTDNPNVVPTQTQSAQAQQQAAITAAAAAAQAAARAAAVTPEQQAAQDAYDQANTSSDGADSDIAEATGPYDDGSTGGTFDADPDTASGAYDRDAEGDSGVYDDNSLDGTSAGNDGLANSALNFVQQIAGMGGSPAGMGGGMGSVRGASDGATAAYEASSSAIQMVWVTNFIESTCADCAGMNGQIVGTSDSFDGSASFADVAGDTYTDLDGPPRHPWCGCSVIPFVDDMNTLGVPLGPPGPTPAAMREFAQQWATAHPHTMPRTLPGRPLSEISEHTKLLHSDDVKLFPQAKFDAAVDTFKSCAIPELAAAPVEHEVVETEVAHEVVETPHVATDLDAVATEEAAAEAAVAPVEEVAADLATAPLPLPAEVHGARALVPQVGDRTFTNPGSGVTITLHPDGTGHSTGSGGSDFGPGSFTADSLTAAKYLELHPGEGLTTAGKVAKLPVATPVGIDPARTYGPDDFTGASPTLTALDTGFVIPPVMSTYALDDVSAPINAALRAGVVPTVAGIMDDHMVGAPTDLLAYRGLALPLGTKLDAGATLSDLGYVSATPDKTYAAAMAGARSGVPDADPKLVARMATPAVPGTEPHTIEVLIPKGAPVFYLPRSKEVVLGRGATFTVTAPGPDGVTRAVASWDNVPEVGHFLDTTAVASLGQAKFANAVELFTACAIPGMEK